MKKILPYSGVVIALLVLVGLLQFYDLVTPASVIATFALMISSGNLIWTIQNQLPKLRFEAFLTVPAHDLPRVNVAVFAFNRTTTLEFVRLGFWKTQANMDSGEPPYAKTQEVFVDSVTKEPKVLADGLGAFWGIGLPRSLCDKPQDITMFMGGVTVVEIKECRNPKWHRQLLVLTQQNIDDLQRAYGLASTSKS